METRNKTISIRISDGEYKELNRLCEKVSLDKSGLIRHALAVFETAYDIVKRHDEEEETKLEIDMNNEEFEYLNNLLAFSRRTSIRYSLKLFPVNSLNSCDRYDLL